MVFGSHPVINGLQVPSGGHLQGGHLRFWTFFGQILDLLKKFWTFQFASRLSGPDITQNIQKRFKNYPNIDCRASTFSCRRDAAADRTTRDIPNFGPFWVVKIQVGAMPPLPHPQ